jgi:hypothetical protein
VDDSVLHTLSIREFGEKLQYVINYRFNIRYPLSEMLGTRSILNVGLFSDFRMLTCI